MPSFSLLCEQLNYRFRDESLIKTALSHRSAGKQNYERLEFLGDSIVGFLIADVLYLRFPDSPEGELSRFRAELVQQSTLAELARELRLGEFLILGRGERISGGAHRDSILSDVLESVISALYLDGGLEACKASVMPWFEEKLNALGNQPLQKDAKTRLQEALQARKKPLPAYEVVQIDGKDHQQQFHVTCRVSLLKEVFSGTGSSRREAEQQAADRVLASLENKEQGK